MKRKLAERDQPSSLQSPVKVKEENGPLQGTPDGKKRGSASRTGTACDRCRLRKMRCDDNPDGCASCRQAQTECKTTDRITGKSTGRGYLDNLEGRLAELEQRNQELRAEVLSLGGQLKPDARDSNPMIDQYDQYPNGPIHGDRSLSTPLAGQRYDGKPSIPAKDPRNDDGLPDRRGHLPPSKKGLHGNNYFGISSGNSLLSSVRGTSMNVLGMEIDLTDYLSRDVDEPDPSQINEPIYNKSYRAFVQTAFGLGPKLSEVRLPARSEGMQFAEIFLRITMPFVPVVHKPTYMNLMTRTYDDTHFKPSVAETVTVHASLAIAYCQYASRGARNPEHQAELHNATNFHYHYALGFFPQLMASHTLADVQALALLCIFLRNCPKPGASWMLTSIVLDLAIELGLHRSATNWAPSIKRNILEIELRKRVFWSINWIHVLVGGSLGRPMALQAGDWDVEVPEAVDDELLSERGLDTSRKGKCGFLAGIENFKVLPIYMDLYNIIYAVGATPPNYEETVRGLERRLQEWHEQWPSEMQDASAFQSEIGRVHLQYLHMWRCHVRLLLRHPSLSTTTSAQFNTESLSMCLDTSKELLYHVKMLQAHRGLDVTWQTSALFVLAIATTLYGRWERRLQLTVPDFNVLKQDMQDWLSILSDMDTLLVAKGQLLNRVQTIIDTTLTNLSQHLIANAAPPLHKAQTAPPSQSTQGHPIPVNQEFPPFQHFPNTNNESQAKSPDDPYLPPAHANTYPSRSQYSSNQNQRTNFDPNLQPQNSLSTTAAAATAYMSSYSQPSYQGNFVSSANADLYEAPGSPTSWRQFTGNMAPNWGSQPGDYMSSASALMQLGNAPRDIVNVPDMEQRRNNVYQEAPTWPMSLFGNDSSGV